MLLDKGASINLVASIFRLSGNTVEHARRGRMWVENGEDILRRLENTLNKRGDPVLLKEEVACFPSLFEDAP